ncbi:hypothetical protein [Sporosarcina cascadiensis]|uniref:hypothetical protein n=1 Tax=Sporosarcina cascadiensis TaxID=2660747 RepID=UPI00129BCE82|nr:hypothetical protein [Sporosarcina cascadiensis]
MLNNWGTKLNKSSTVNAYEYTVLISSGLTLSQPREKRQDVLGEQFLTKDYVDFKLIRYMKSKEKNLLPKRFSVRGSFLEFYFQETRMEKIQSISH